MEPFGDFAFIDEICHFEVYPLCSTIVLCDNLYMFYLYKTYFMGTIKPVSKDFVIA